MQLEITKLRRSPVFDDIIYVDVLIADFGIIIKGIRFNFVKNMFTFPIHKTELGVSFEPFQMSPETFKTFKEQFLDLIQDQKIPKEKDHVTEEQRKKILDKFRGGDSKKNVPGRLPGQKKADGPGKPE